MRPDKRGAGLTKLGNQFVEVLLIVVQRHLPFSLRCELEVVQTPVEVDHVPVSAVQPLIQLFQPARCGAAVFRDPMHVGFAVKESARRQGVANGNGIAYQKHVRQARVVLDGGKRRGWVLRKSGRRQEKNSRHPDGKSLQQRLHRQAKVKAIAFISNPSFACRFFILLSEERVFGFALANNPTNKKTAGECPTV